MKSYFGSGSVRLQQINLNPGITTIGRGAFQYQSELTSITLPAQLTTVGQSPFYGCASLKEIDFPKAMTAIPAYMFDGCTALTEDDFPIPGQVTEIGAYAFKGCTGLTKYTIPDSVEWIGAGVFYGCTNLKSLTVPFIGESPSTSYTFSYLFNSDKYTSSCIPDKLETVTVTSASSIAAECFCTYYMKSYFGSGSVRLQQINLNPGITTIGREAFRGQSELTSIYLPASLNNIGSSAFYGCTGLQELFYGGTEEQWAAVSIGDGNDILSSIPIHFNASPEDLASDADAEDVEAPDAARTDESGTIEPAEGTGPNIEPVPTEEPAPTEEPDPVIEPAPTEEPDPVIEPAPTEEPGYIGLASFSGSERSETGSETIYTASFSGLMPGEEYLILAVRSEEESVLLDNDNILFAGQREADENGSLSIRYIKKSNDPASLRCYGMSDKCFTESDKLSVVISRGATDSNAYALAVAYDGVELKENRDYLVSFAYLEDEVVQITLTGIVDYSGSAVILAKASCTEADTIDGYAVIHMAHEWSEPVWTWSEDQSRAEAVFTCTRDETHSITRSCEVSAVTENNVTTWTAAVSLGGKQYTEVRRLFHGDLNADEKVDALDLAVMRNLLIGLSQEGLERADVNGDGAVNILDLVRLRKHLTGQEVILH